MHSASRHRARSSLVRRLNGATIAFLLFAAAFILLDVRIERQPTKTEERPALSLAPAAPACTQPPPPPHFYTNPVNKPDAMEGAAYSGSIANDAYSYYGKSFSKLSHTGPGGDWLTIASNGALSGTPMLAHVGQHQWGVRVTNPYGHDDATLNITVQPFHFTTSTITVLWEDGDSTNVAAYLIAPNGGANVTWQASGLGTMVGGAYHFGPSGEQATITATLGGVDRPIIIIIVQMLGMKIKADLGTPGTAEVCDEDQDFQPPSQENTLTLRQKSDGKASLFVTLLYTPSYATDCWAGTNYRLWCQIINQDTGWPAAGWIANSSGVMTSGGNTWMESFSGGQRFFKIRLYLTGPTDANGRYPDFDRELYCRIVKSQVDYWEKDNLPNRSFIPGGSTRFYVGEETDVCGHFYLRPNVYPPEKKNSMVYRVTRYDTQGQVVNGNFSQVSEVCIDLAPNDNLTDGRKFKLEVGVDSASSPNGQFDDGEAMGAPVDVWVIKLDHFKTKTHGAPNYEVDDSSDNDNIPEWPYNDLLLFQDLQGHAQLDYNITWLPTNTPDPYSAIFGGKVAAMIVDPYFYPAIYMPSSGIGDWWDAGMIGLPESPRDLSTVLWYDKNSDWNKDAFEPNRMVQTTIANITRLSVFDADNSANRADSMYWQYAQYGAEGPHLWVSEKNGGYATVGFNADLAPDDSRIPARSLWAVGIRNELVAQEGSFAASGAKEFTWTPEWFSGEDPDPDPDREFYIHAGFDKKNTHTIDDGYMAKHIVIVHILKLFAFELWTNNPSSAVWDDTDDDDTPPRPANRFVAVQDANGHAAINLAASVTDNMQLSRLGDNLRVQICNEGTMNTASNWSRASSWSLTGSDNSNLIIYNSSTGATWTAPASGSYARDFDLVLWHDENHNQQLDAGEPHRKLKLTILPAASPVVIDSIVYSRDEWQTYDYAPAPPETLFVIPNETVDFCAIMNDWTQSWPQGKPQWTFAGTGVTGDPDGAMASVQFTALSTQMGDKSVSAECGNTKTALVSVVTGPVIKSCPAFFIPGGANVVKYRIYPDWYTASCGRAEIWRRSESGGRLEPMLCSVSLSYPDDLTGGVEHSFTYSGTDIQYDPQHPDGRFIIRIGVGEEENDLLYDQRPFDVARVDIRVDSNNSNGWGGGDGQDDAIEEQSPGKIIPINQNDGDGDGIPDYADGFGAFIDNAASRSNPQENLAQLSLDLSAFIGFDRSKIRVKFSYPAAPVPATTTEESCRTAYENIYSPDSYTDGAGKVDVRLRCAYPRPSSGAMRIWKKNGNAVINRVASDYIQSGVDYTLNELIAPPGWSRTLFIEGIAAVEGADVQCLVSYDGHNASTDKVKVTVVDANVNVNTDNDPNFALNPDDDAIEDQRNGFAFWPGANVNAVQSNGMGHVDLMPMDLTIPACLASNGLEPCIWVSKFVGNPNPPYNVTLYDRQGHGALDHIQNVDDWGGSLSQNGSRLTKISMILDPYTLPASCSTLLLNFDTPGEYTISFGFKEGGAMCPFPMAADSVVVTIVDPSLWFYSFGSARGTRDEEPFRWFTYPLDEYLYTAS